MYNKDESTEVQSLLKKLQELVQNVGIYAIMLDRITSVPAVVNYNRDISTDELKIIITKQEEILSILEDRLLSLSETDSDLFS